MAMTNLKELPYISHHISSGPGTTNEPTYQNVEAASTSRNFSTLQVSVATETQEQPTTSDLEESGRGCRTKRKQIEPLFCPVCSITVRSTELEAHYLSELSKLDKLSSNGKRKSTMSTSGSSGSSGTSGSGTSTTQETQELMPPEKCWETYQNVKANRQSRLKMKSRKRKLDDVVCPVCNNTISGDLNQHVEECLRKNGGCESSDEDGDEDIDVGGDDFGEYEWAGQHRVRASSMLEGGYSAVGIGTCVQRIKNDEEEDLVVDGDDSDKYGPPQYTERDIMLVSKGEDKDQTALRLAIIGSDENAISKDDGTINSHDSVEAINELIDEDDGAEQSKYKNPTVEALKQRVRELERSESNKGQYKCLICMGRYKTPVISICCWHVHCELCWLKTLGIKKLCPQCNMITSPTDLRKVYI